MRFMLIVSTGQGQAVVTKSSDDLSLWYQTISGIKINDNGYFVI